MKYCLSALILTLLSLTSLANESANGPEQAADMATLRFGEFIDDGLFKQAEVSASQALWNARLNYGEESVEAALAQINLANAQQKQANHTAAIDNFEQSMRRIESAEGIVSPLLVDALMGLASSNMAIGAFDRGVVNYERALRLNHVELGLYNEDQIPIRDGLTEAYLALGEKDEAEFEQEIQVVIFQQEYGRDSDKVLPAMYKLANWYERTNQPQKEAYQYQQIIRMIREKADKNSPNQIEALREMSRTYYRMNMPAESMRLLKRAYRLNAEADEPDTLLAADIQVEIGDFYNLFGSRKDALRYYQIAWDMLVSSGDQEEKLDGYFAKPVFLEGPPLPTVYPASASKNRLFQEQPDLFNEGFASAVYEVDEAGRVQNIRIIESDPTELIDKKFRLALSRQRYRPRLVDREPVETTDEQTRLVFNYEIRSNKAQNNSRPEKLSRPGQ